MNLTEAIQARRSIRKFLPDPVPDSVVHTALQAAVLAPNSSNTQIWHFHWVKSADKKQRLVQACFSQSAARTAQHLVVVTTDPALWRRSHPALLKWVEEAKAPKLVVDYYAKLIPWLYRWGFLNCLAPFKWLGATLVGLFRPMQRGPYGLRSIQEVGIKSAALASENFVLSITDQGYATCMMEGFDEVRVRRLLGLRHSARVVMVIGLGKEAPRGTWGPRFRLPLDQVVTEI